VKRTGGPRQSGHEQGTDRDPIQFSPSDRERFWHRATFLAAIQVADEQMGPGPLSVGRTTERLRTVVDRSDRVRLLSLDLLCPCLSLHFLLFLLFLLHPADTDRPFWGYPRGAPTAQRAQRAQAARGRDLAVGSVVEKEGPSRLVDNLEAFQQLPGPTHQTQSRKGQAGAIKDDRSGRALVGLGKPIDYG
jgi:hypothetical protein